MREIYGGDSIGAWILRLIKGIIIGTGFIIPGVSGGVFAAIFGVYEPMIHFFANIRKDFWKNVWFFAPIGVGVLISMVLCSKALSEFFERSEIPLVWFFIGCVVGTLPQLFTQAGKRGRSNRHYVILVASMAVMFLFFSYIQSWLSQVAIPTDSFVIWLMAGALMGLGAIVPGLSPSNFLLYMGIYGEMMRRIGGMDWMVIIPIVAGALLCFLLLSKIFDKLFDRAYAGLSHFILGIVVISTVMIIPMPGKVLESGNIVAYDTPLTLVCLGTCVAGIALGYFMGVLEKRFKPQD